MRASDSDRQRTIDELRRHCAAGRIDIDEYTVRIEQALTATTLEELDGIRADLPMLRIPDPGGRGEWAGESPASSLPAVLSRRGDHEAGSPARRLAALTVAAVTVAMVVAAIILVFLSEWGWAAALAVGWAIGLAQGRMGPGRR